MAELTGLSNSDVAQLCSDVDPETKVTTKNKPNNYDI